MQFNGTLGAMQREAYIIDCLLKQGYVQVRDLASELSVSQSTIRKDLAVLEQRGLLRRTHGGATNVQDFTYDLNSFYRNREVMNIAEKQRIGQLAAKRIQQDQVVAFSSGTTPLQVAYYIPKELAFTAITNDIEIVRALASYKNVDVFVPGGFLKLSRKALIASDAASRLQGFEIDQVFLTVTGFDLKRGVTAGHISNVVYMRELIARSKQCVVVADSSKLHNPPQIVICGWKEIDVWITDKAAPNDIIQAVGAHGVSIITA